MINEREIALDILIKITQDNSYNNLALKDTLGRHNYLNGIQKGFITEIVNGTLRNLILLD